MFAVCDFDFMLTSLCLLLTSEMVSQIDRIQSQSQWQRYCVLKQAVDKKYPKRTNERQLYHGTTKEICQKINKNGFNRSFCGRNGTSHVLVVVKIFSQKHEEKID